MSAALSNLRRRALGLALASVLLALPLLANGLPTAKPEEVGMSSERLARLTELMETRIAEGVAPGALAMISRQGKIVYAQEWGLADRENGVPMRPDTIFRIYSMTKPITSVAVMMLYEEGRFALNDPLERHLPEFADMKVMEEVEAEGSGEAEWTSRDARRKITIRDLLRHTAGLTYGVFGNTPVDQQYRDAELLMDDRDLATFSRHVGEMPLLFEPGTTWHYSVATDILGRLVEVVSGMPFDELVAERITGPLGMVDTAFWVPESKRDRFAQLYSPAGTAEGADAWLEPSDSKELVVAQAQASRNFVRDPPMPSGGGGMVSTASDYMRFCLMLLRGGELDGVRLLSPKSVELMTTSNLGDIPMGMGRSGYGFGLGFAVATDLGRIGELGSEGEYNWGGAAGTAFWIDPEEELIGVYMVQILPHRTTLGGDFKRLTYQAIVE
ncbi:MAG TPA: serine hydrolase domain-containing protein [Thermoanaerobaculia bacterium]|nr:serine hydrolase domain-containing protein [Thermoanaerobaculia bacterium]